jgi:hypothetical protein
VLEIGGTSHLFISHLFRKEYLKNSLSAAPYPENQTEEVTKQPDVGDK